MKIQVGDEVREMTADEAANRNNVLAEQMLAIAEIESRAAALESARNKLAALGLTADEITALLGK